MFCTRVIAIDSLPTLILLVRICFGRRLLERYLPTIPIGFVDKRRTGSSARPRFRTVASIEFVIAGLRSYVVDGTARITGHGCNAFCPSLVR
jgi:hypothetical protein